MIIYLEKLGITIESDGNKGSIKIKSDGSVVIEAPVEFVTKAPVVGPIEMQTADTVKHQVGTNPASKYQVQPATIHPVGTVSTLTTTAGPGFLMNAADPLRVGVSELDKVEKVVLPPAKAKLITQPANLDVPVAPIKPAANLSGLADIVLALNQVDQDAATALEDGKDVNALLNHIAEYDKVLSAPVDDSAWAQCPCESGNSLVDYAVPKKEVSALDEQHPLNDRINDPKHPIIRGFWETPGNEKSVAMSKRISDGYKAASILNSLKKEPT